MKKQTNRLLSILLTLVMLLGMMPTMAVAAEIPIPVTTEGNTYSLFTEENLEGQFGTTFLYVVKSGDRYYTPAHPGSIGDFAEKDSVAAVDITAYWDEDTNTFSGIPASANVGVMQYQSYTLPEYGTSALFLDGNVMFSLSVPFGEDGETWFDGGIRYYDREQTYSYSRALWEATGDGSGYFYDRYTDWTDWYDTKETVYGVLALKNGDCFALRNFSEAFAKEETIDVNGYLYAAPCGHAAPEHSAYVAPTCMDKGCKEYWYCVYCDTYFKDADCEEAYECKPVLPALDHNYGDTACDNCGNPVPVYTKITSYEQFKTVNPNASFIAVAEIDDGNGGKDYYVLKKEISAPDADIDENGSPDILQVDEDSNGVADVLEIDTDGDGVADVMDFDGIHSSEPDGVLDDDEIWEYLFALQNEYTDGYIPSLHTIGVIPVTPAQDGTISVKNLGALEWIMERKISDDELDDQYYGDGATVKDYENDFRFRIPNFWIRPVVTISNNYYQQPYEQGDSKWWGVLFGKDAKELDLSEYRPLPVSYPDDAVVLYTEGFHSLNLEGQVEHALRFLVNGGEKNFIITSDSFWDELEGTQYPVYLYCSDAGDEVHQHVWGPWNPNTEETHKRVCTIDGCSEYELASHTPGTDYEQDTTDYSKGHWVTCTECDGQIHEYHEMEKVPGYGTRYDYWRDTGDGIHHVVNCTKCLGPVEYAEHRWYDWYSGNKQIDGEWVTGHYTSCKDWPCEASKWQAECIYDEGTVTTEPTCTEKGVRTFTCIAEGCTLDGTYTEEIPALDHDWGEWAPKDGDATKEQRVCKRDASHIEERDAAAHEHSWSDWTPDGDENHKRDCMDDNCDKFETLPHEWDNGEITKEPTCKETGVKTYTCQTCMHTRTEDVPTTDHVFGDWTPNNDGTTHSRYCSCNESETADHKFDDGVVTEQPTHVEPGIKTYTCTDCGYSYEEDIPVLTDHAWGEWVINKLDEANTHIRYCICDETQTAPHNFDEGVVTEPATHTSKGVKTYTCTDDCGYSYTEEIPETPEHEWTNWSPNDDGTHTRACRCNANETKPCEWDDGVVTAPTCTEEGKTVYTCTVCGNTKTEPKPALDHDWGDWIDTGANAPADIHERSCKRDGCDAKEFGNHEWGNWISTGATEHKKTCSVCSGTRTADHEWNNGEVKHPATQIEDGLKVYTCVSCGEEKKETIPKLDIPVNNTPNDNAAGGQLAGSDSELIEDVLTEEEKAAVADGSATVSIYLEVEDISDTVVPAEATAATNAAAASGAQIGMYLDIDLFKDVTTVENGTDTTQITETNGKVTITIVVPDELINTDASKERVYRIIRVHEDESGNLITDVIEGIFDPVAKTFTFETDKFSTYVVVYNDSEVRPGGNGGSSGGGSAPAAYSITVANSKNGSVSVTPKTAANGETVIVTVTPEKGYTLETLTVTDKNGKAIELTGKGDGKYIFKMPASKVTVQASFMDDNTMLNFFVDVPADAYYYDAVLWAAKSGITSGTTATTFAPGNPCTRAQMVVFLWRAAGSPEPKGNSTLFTDVTADAYYAKAVQWAVENGITLGTSANTFSPNGLCTRAQMATFIYRNEQANGGGFTGAWMFLLPFTDVSGWAYEPIAWCYKEGITSGTTATTFAPNDPCTRAQMVAFLYRYMK